MDDIKLKKEVVEKIKSSTNILITVSNDPSVDALSAALGLTLALNKIEKYATAIFSGATPPAINFLEPEKTFENNTDSLRDFIIALNREKADHLKFKPDGDYVKIFITPYRTTIKPEDLEFSQGDFNVELVIALGVDNQDHLDGALDNHGQILHDATVITMTVGDMTSALGGIDWHDAQSSSLSEMTVGLVEALKEDSKSAIIDAPIATALLTGIVAQTDRFSNSYTTSKVMTVAANLMTAGADQQLVAFKLQESHEISQNVDTNSSSDGGNTDAQEIKLDTDAENAYSISREDIVEQSSEGAQEASAEENAAPSESQAPENTEAPQDAAEDSQEPQESQESQEPAAQSVTAEEPAPLSVYALEKEPTEGGEETSQPAEPATDDSSRAYIAGPSPLSAYAPEPLEEPAASTDAPEGFPGTPNVAPGSVTVNDTPVHETILSHEEPVAPAGPADLGLPMPPPLPDFSSVGITPPPAIPVPPVPQPEILGDILAPEPAQATSIPVVDAPVTPVAPEGPVLPPAPVNPGQFQIPPQQ